MDDLISRKAAIDIMQAKGEAALGTPKAVFYNVAHMLELLPAVDAEPVRHGKWMRREVPRNGEIHTLYVCSECGDYHGSTVDPGVTTFRDNFRYCRICGARMDGGGT